MTLSKSQHCSDACACELVCCCARYHLHLARLLYDAMRCAVDEIGRGLKRASAKRTFLTPVGDQHMTSGALLALNSVIACDHHAINSLLLNRRERIADAEHRAITFHRRRDH